MRNISTWVAVAVGGALGGLMRAVIDFGSLTSGTSNLWSVLLVNLVGAGLLGVAVGHGMRTWSVAFRAGITTGFLGSFTTFSAIMTGWLSVTLKGEPLLALAYIAATFFGGVAAAYGGAHAGEWWRDVAMPQETS